MNVILVVMDTLRKDHVGAYGNDWIRTPNLDRFAEESVRFDRAYPEVMPTIPFRNSLLTGKRVFPFDRWKAHLASWPILQWYGRREWNVPGWSPLDPDDIYSLTEPFQVDIERALVLFGGYQEVTRLEDCEWEAVPWIVRSLWVQNRLRGSLKQQRISHLSVTRNYTSQFRGNGEYDMEIPHRQQSCQLFFKPCSTLTCLTESTVPVPA